MKSSDPRCESEFSFICCFSTWTGIDRTRHTHRSTALGSALLAGSAIGLFGWDISKPETLDKVNTKGSTLFNPKTTKEQRAKKWAGWQRAVERSKGWNADSVDYGDDD